MGIISGLALICSACIATTSPEPISLEETSPFPQAFPTPVVEETHLIDEVGEAIPAQPDGQNLLGLEPKIVEDLFGGADFVRWDGNALVRQYKNETCVLDIVFYEELSGEPYKSTHYESRSLEGKSFDINLCLEAFFEIGKIPAKLLKGGGS